MVQKEIVLTLAGLEKLEDELEVLKTKKRREIAERIKQAIAFGDITENSEYDEAKKEQAFIEGRIGTIENLLKNAKVIDDEDISVDVVSIGSLVTVKDLAYDETVEYKIVSSAEADPSRLMISNESPVGKALMGHEAGDVVEIMVPDGSIEFRIVEIKK
ncbi:MAG: transcription elongation factor GreA [Firmicutes bacterium]|nr:transcription elongation factor GreA [Bacillota bacterium]MDD3298067.1 transcription elongation factor GreA [Bacillota bacterium]MDD3851032.1 transcription elongation factor GreA [Bacillota bacterium]MDD4707878.1 transcription elongation factor GreA [Bacillota bacterium]